MAVEAMKARCGDFITKPIDYTKLRALLTAVSANLELRPEVAGTLGRLDPAAGFGDFIGTSRVMREVYKLLREIGGPTLPSSSPEKAGREKNWPPARSTD